MSPPFGLYTIPDTVDSFDKATSQSLFLPLPQVINKHQQNQKLCDSKLNDI